MGSDLHVLPEVFHTSVVILVSGPPRAVDCDQTGKLHATHRLHGKVLDFVDIFLANLLALLSVIDVVSSDHRRDGEKDEPVTRREARSLVKP